MRIDLRDREREFTLLGIHRSGATGSDGQGAGDASSDGRGKRSGLRKALLVLPLSFVALAAPATAGAALPDNRGWEVVTPADQGDDVHSLAWVSPDGNATAFKSLASFAGGVNGGGNGYLSRRGAGSWNTLSMTPPGGGYGAEPSYVAVGVTPDGDRFVWSGVYDNPNQSRDVFLGTGPRTAVNMSAVVRPDASSAVYVGKTPEADHVLFSVRPPLGQPDPQLLYDYTGGIAQPVGILPGETTPNPDGAVLGSFERDYGTGSVFNAVSDDGSRIFFESPAPEPVGSGAIPNPSGLYVREHGATTKAIDPKAIYWDATPDGETVLYTPADASGDLGLSTYDVTNEQPTQIAPPSAQVRGIGGTSDDLSRVYFVALGDLAGGATAGQPNLYLYDAGNAGAPLRFIATLNPNPGGTFAEAQRFSSQDLYAGDAITSMASANGRLLVFASSARLTDYDNQGTQQLYLFDVDATADPLVCISCGPDGVPPLGDSFLSAPRNSNVPVQAGSGVAQLIEPPTNITVDNRRVFFESRNALAPQDQNGQTDVYEWTDGAAHLISSGTGLDARFVIATASGDDAFFITKNDLTWQARSSNLRAIYDARVGGGFPQPVVPPRCEEDRTCQGPGSPPPPPPLIGSVAFDGDGNVPRVSRPAQASVSVSKLKAVTGSSAKLKVRVPAAGKVSVSGSSIRSSSVSAAKAGSYTVKVALGATAKVSLKKRKTLKVSVRVTYRATDGQTATKTVQVTFKQPKAKAKKGGR
jgi:hypothetical protein